MGTVNLIAPRSDFVFTFSLCCRDGRWEARRVPSSPRHAHTTHLFLVCSFLPVSLFRAAAQAQGGKDGMKSTFSVPPDPRLHRRSSDALLRLMGDAGMGA